MFGFVLNGITFIPKWYNGKEHEVIQGGDEDEKKFMKNCLQFAIF